MPAHHTKKTAPAPRPPKPRLDPAAVAPQDEDIPAASHSARHPPEAAPLNSDVEIPAAPPMETAVVPFAVPKKPTAQRSARTGTKEGNAEESDDESDTKMSLSKARLCSLLGVLLAPAVLKAIHPQVDRLDIIFDPDCPGADDSEVEVDDIMEIVDRGEELPLGFTLVWPRFIRDYESSGIPPFWKPVCPSEFKNQWGKKWNEIHDELFRIRTEGSTMTRSACRDFVWPKSGVLNDLKKVGLARRWDEAHTATPPQLVELLGATRPGLPLTVFMSDAHQTQEVKMRDKVPESGHWDSYQDQIAAGLYGYVLADLPIPHVIYALIGTFLTRETYRLAHKHMRQKKSYEKNLAKLEGLLGAGYSGPSIAIGSTLPKDKYRVATTTCKKLMSAFDFIPTSRADRSLLSAETDPPSSPAELHGLLEQYAAGGVGRGLEITARCLGYLTHVSQARVTAAPTPANPLHRPAFLRGVMGGKLSIVNWEDHVESLTPEDVEKMEGEVLA
ncbi:hypothetical protein GGX14DRAFT_403870 [Mycena pura]|uniref:Uncharacterized protein n=1 Tax=Mycena pura TaxID=153505 RepID=A0AAD6Y288_9AGAR|nr:hypothetical protein GGX14DRAFT_403870 [Mycena pura]